MNNIIQIQGSSHEEIFQSALGYILHGYEPLTSYVTYKYGFFGKRTYHIHLQLKRGDRTIFDVGKAMHEMVFPENIRQIKSSEDIQNPILKAFAIKKGFIKEPTDEELLAQENYEELAKRHKQK